PENDAFYVSWEEFKEQLAAKGMTMVEVAEMRAESETSTSSVEAFGAPTHGAEEIDAESNEVAPEAGGGFHILDSPSYILNCSSLDAFRPLGTRAPEPQIAEAQRREFFAQLHRWARQGRAVHVFCNNDGERQRFSEVWKDYGFGELESGKRTEPGP